MDKNDFLPENVWGVEQAMQLLEALKRMIEMMNSLSLRPAVVNQNTNYYYAPHLEHHGPVTYQAPIHNYSQERRETKTKVTNEDIAKTLIALNGKGKPVDTQTAWLGVCCYLAWKHGFPRNLGDCCKAIDNLPMNMEELEYECKYESIRRFGCWNFVKVDVSQWPSYTPRADEKQMFLKCLAVSQALEAKLLENEAT